MSGIEDLLNSIRRLMEMDSLSIEQRALKLAEETGELCEAVVATYGAVGCTYKNKTPDDIIEESQDVVICAIAAALHSRPEIKGSEYTKGLIQKLVKWENKIKAEEKK